MKKKIVINVHMDSEKAKSKAMKIAVAIHGVISVGIGKENDRLEVIGEGVDSVRLVNSLRKKFCFADILSLEEVQPPLSCASSSPDHSSPSPPHPGRYCPPPPYCPSFYYEYRVYDDAPPNCSIL